MMIIVLFLMLNFLMIFSAHLIAFKYMYRVGLAEHSITTFLIYIFQICISVIIAGSFLKDLSVYNLTLLNFLITVIIIIKYRKDIKLSLRETGKKISGFLTYFAKSNDYFLLFLLFLFVFQVLLTLYKIYLLPPYVGDVFVYHLHPMVNWLKEGKILTITDTPVFRTDMNPLGAKFLHLWFVKFFGHITWIELPQYFFGIILSFSSYVLMIKMKILKSNALRYGILIYFMPMVLLHSRTNQDHLIYASLIFISLVYLVNIVFEKKPVEMIFLSISLSLLFSIKKHSLLPIIILFIALIMSRGFSVFDLKKYIKKNVIIFFSSFGLFVVYSGYFIFIKNKMLYNKLFFFKIKYIGIKYFIFIIIGLLLILLVRIIITNKLIKKSTWNKLPQSKMILKFIIPLVILMVLSIGLITIKNWSSIRPFLFGAESPARYTNRNFAVQYPALKSNFVRNLIIIPFRIRDTGYYYGYTPDLLEQSGFGIQFFAFGLIGYIMFITLSIFKKSYRNSIMGFLVLFSFILLFVFFFVYFSWANYRLFLFFGVIGMMCWAIFIDKINLKPFLGRIIDALIIIMIIFNGAVCFYEGNLIASRWKTLLTIDNPLDRTSIKYAAHIKRNGWDSWQFIDQYIPASDPIGFSGGNDAWTFPYYDNQLKRKIYYIKKLPGFSIKNVKQNEKNYQYLNITPTFLNSLKQRNIHYIHFSTQGTPHRFKIFITPGQDDIIIKVTDNLYYVRWQKEI